MRTTCNGANGTHAAKGTKAPTDSLEQLAKAYLDDLEVRANKPKTIAGSKKNLHTFVTWAGEQGATTLREFTADLVKSYIRYQQHKPKWAERHYRKRSEEVVSAGAIRNYVRDLKAFASWLAEDPIPPSMCSPVSVSPRHAGPG